MARIHSVKKAAKDQGSCSVCGQPIPAGTSYKWTAPRAGRFTRGRKLKAHVGCQFRPSQLTTSEIKGQLYDLQDDARTRIHDAVNGEELKEIAEDIAGQIREVAEQAREKANNIESGFGHEIPASAELNERADAIEGWADEIEQVDFDGFELDADEVIQMIVDDEDLNSLKDRYNEWRDEQRGQLESAMENCPE